MAASYLAYENIADKINYINFFDELELNDTFYSWFVITELHIWMLSVRFMAEGEQGRFMRNYLTEALWNDVSQRIKKLGEVVLLYFNIFLYLIWGYFSQVMRV